MADKNLSVESCLPNSGRKQGKRFVIENVSISKCCHEETHPATIRPPKEEIDRRIKCANDLWRLNYDSQVCHTLTTYCQTSFGLGKTKHYRIWVSNTHTKIMRIFTFGTQVS